MNTLNRSVRHKAIKYESNYLLQFKGGHPSKYKAGSISLHFCNLTGTSIFSET